MQIVVNKKLVRVLNPNFSSEAFMGVIEDFIYSKLDSLTVMERGSEMDYITYLISHSLNLIKNDYTMEECATEKDYELFPNAKSTDILIDENSIEVEFCHLILDMVKFARKHAQEFHEQRNSNPWHIK